VFLIRRRLILQPVCAAKIDAIANVWTGELGQALAAKID